MIDKSKSPEIIEYINNPLNYIPCDVKWIPYSTKFVVIGHTSLGKGIIQIYQMNKGKLDLISEFIKENGFKCSTFETSSFAARDLAVGDFDGNLIIYDLEKGTPCFEIKKAHKSLIHAIDGIGGSGNIGSTELVTVGKDGVGKIWDLRANKPVIEFPSSSNEKELPECWAVSFGNSHNYGERCVGLGYDNGDIKIYDIRASKLKWKTNLKYGISSLEFDKKDIPINKMIATTFESKLHVFDLVSNNPDFEFESINDANHNSTIWGSKFLPQNKDIFISMDGNGVVNLYKYNYSDKNNLDGNNINNEVKGILSVLNTKEITTKPIIGFDWHQNKIGLACLISLDYSVKIEYITRLNLY